MNGAQADLRVRLTIDEANRLKFGKRTTSLFRLLSRKHVHGNQSIAKNAVPQCRGEQLNRLHEIEVGLIVALLSATNQKQDSDGTSPTLILMRSPTAYGFIEKMSTADTNMLRSVSPKMNEMPSTKVP